MKKNNLFQSIVTVIASLCLAISCVFITPTTVKADEATIEPKDIVALLLMLALGAVEPIKQAGEATVEGLKDFSEALYNKMPSTQKAQLESVNYYPSGIATMPYANFNQTTQWILDYVHSLTTAGSVFVNPTTAEATNIIGFIPVGTLTYFSASNTYQYYYGSTFNKYYTHRIFPTNYKSTLTVIRTNPTWYYVPGTLTTLTTQLVIKMIDGVNKLVYEQSCVGCQNNPLPYDLEILNVNYNLWSEYVTGLSLTWDPEMELDPDLTPTDSDLELDNLPLRYTPLGGILVGFGGLWDMINGNTPEDIDVVRNPPEDTWTDSGAVPIPNEVDVPLDPDVEIPTDVPETNTGIIGALGGLLNSLFGWLAGLLKGILDALGSLLNYLMQMLAALIAAIGAIGASILDGLGGILSGLFVPTVDLTVTLDGWKALILGIIPCQTEIAEFFGNLSVTTDRFAPIVVMMFDTEITFSIYDMIFAPFLNVASYVQLVFRFVIWIAFMFKLKRLTEGVLSSNGGEAE